MALILLEGLDRTGKSTVASYYESLGFELVHLSAPSRDMSSDQYLLQMIDLVSSAATKDIVMDRTHYGELVWPQVYGRKSILSEDDIQAIREVEESVGVKRILMYDSNVEEHWKRCVDNREPLNKAQFARARSLYTQIAHKYDFEPITLPQFLKQFPDAEAFNVQNSTKSELIPSLDSFTKESESINKTPEQLKLEKANAINDILSKRILKTKGDIYDDLEKDIRSYLNSKLGKLLGGTNSELSLTPEEIKFYKIMYKKALDKGDAR